MNHSFSYNFEGKLNNLGGFYYDRFMRIYPMYLFIFIMTVVFLILTGYGQAHFSLKNITSNLLIIPLNFFMFTDIPIVLQNPKWNIIPPAWSLGAELQFYLLVPFLIRFNYFRKIALVLSVGIFGTASFGLINTDNFGYRLLPGILFIFLTGVSLYDYRSLKGPVNLKLLKIIYMLMLVVLIAASVLGKLNSPYTYEVQFGYLIGVLVVFVLSGINYEPLKKLDDLLGGMSYPLFLCHFLSIWIFQYIFERFNLSLDVKGFSVICLLLSIFVSYVSYKYIDVPFQEIRKKIQVSKRRAI